MTRTCRDLMTVIENADSCHVAAKAMQAIVTGLAAERLVTEVFEAITMLRSIAFERLDAHCARIDHRPYYVATGMEANLMYIATSFGECMTDEPHWILAKLGYLATKLADAADNPIDDVGQVRIILRRCHEFCPKLKKQKSVLVMAFPDIDIDCVATHTFYKNMPVTVVNTKCESVPHIKEYFAYESSALQLVGDQIPEAGLDLIEKTIDPDIRSKDPEAQQTAYLKGLRLGFGRPDPYGFLIDCTDEEKVHSKAWWLYVRHLGVKRVSIPKSVTQDKTEE